MGRRLFAVVPLVLYKSQTLNEMLMGLTTQSHFENIFLFRSIRSFLNIAALRMECETSTIRNLWSCLG